MNRWRKRIALLGAVVALSFGLSVASGANDVESDDVALFDPGTGTWTLRHATGVTESFYYGNPGDTPLMGDWDCDGTDTVAMYRSDTGFIYYRDSNSFGVADNEFFFGQPGDVPIAGDWDGDGCDTFGIYRSGTVYLSNALGTRPADSSFYFGIPGDRPFAGDFDGDGIDTTGLYRTTTGFVYFTDSIPSEGAVAPTDNSFFYGNPSDLIITGDWDDDGVDTVGIFRPSERRFYLSNANAQRPADIVIELGTSSSLPIAGRLGSPPPQSTTTTTTSTTTLPPTSNVAECLARPSKTVLTGTYTERVKISSPPDDHTVDAREAVSETSGERALEVGSSRTANGGCFVGWSTFGQQSRVLTWRQMHDDITGSALRVYGSNYVVDGLRAENVEDAFDPRGGENFEVRNMWTEYVRDDCIENDERRAGIVIDSLFDGCYTFFSEQEEGTVAGESLIFDQVLVRLQPMPGPHGTTDPSILGHGSFFKKFDDGGRHEPIIRDSVFFLEDDCYSGCKDWPAGTTASNVVIVWVGEGAFPMSVLPGMTLTTDRAVWDLAAQEWKQRHGCTTIDQPCTHLHDPAP